MAKKEKKIDEWYLPNGEESEPKGPYKAAQILQMIETRELTYFDYIWSVAYADRGWIQIYTLTEFHMSVPFPKAPVPKVRSRGLMNSVKNVHLNFQREGEYGTENKYRRYPRSPIFGRIIIHDQMNITEGNSIDVSEKGMMIKITGDKKYNVGDELNLTYVSEDQSFETFSAQCVVVRKVHDDTLGLYFLKINPIVKRNIANFIIEYFKKAG